MPFDVEAAKQAGYSDAEIQAYLRKKQSPAPPTTGQRIWHAASAPMRGVARLGGQLDVAAGLKTPEEAEGNVERYGDIGTGIVGVGLGGALAGAAGGGTLFPALGRIFASGGIDALKANEGERLKEGFKGGLMGAVGEGIGAATSRVMHPLSFLKKLIPSAGPREGERWVKDYLYGTIKRYPDLGPVLLKDIIKNEPIARAIPGALGSAGRAATDVTVDELRKYLDPEYTPPPPMSPQPMSPPVPQRPTNRGPSLRELMR